MLTRLKAAALLCAAAGLPSLALYAQQPAPTAPTEISAPKVVTQQKEAQKGAPKASPEIEKIIEEGTKRSQVMKTLSHLTDVIGPRLTGSPNLKRANEWTRDQLGSWGLSDAHLEPWGPFGRGWTLKAFSMQVVEPQCIPLIAYPKAWSVGVEGKVTAEVVYFDVKAEADFAKYKGKLKDKIVLMSPPADVPAHFEAQGARLTPEQLLALADAAPPGTGGGGGRPRRAQGGPGGDFMAQMALARRKLPFLVEEGAAAAVDVSRTGDGGTLFVAQASPAVAPPPGAGGPGGGGGGGQGGPRVWDKDAPKNVPQITVAKEHYNRLIRMMEQGEKLKMTLELAVEFQDQDLMAYNTVAEIPGTDLKDEIVMLGGHLDSWHAGTGATDNAAGCSVGMEAVRILKTLDLKPRRTIRIALWSGEEEGLMGSRAYVKAHFGESQGGGMGLGGGGGGGGGGGAPPQLKVTKKADYDKFSAYFNLDNGTGKVRGVYLQGNEAVRPIFRQWLMPFREMGASTLSISNTGGTDHLSFDAIGLPGFQFIQDEIEYDTRTHHSNQDVFDRIQADDMKQAAVIMASFIYQTANRDEKLPRKAQPIFTNQSASLPVAPATTVAK
jgi:carboxypeptidase Q